MRQISEGIYRLGAKLHNFYLIVEGGKATVIDAGGSKELPKLEGALASLGLSMDAVQAILLTHAHSDHIGFAALAQKQHGTALKVHEKEAAYARDGSVGSQVSLRDIPLWKPRVWAFAIEMVRDGVHKDYRLKVFDTIADGDVLELPGKPRVIGTPGHTAGHASYLLEDRKALFAGDALVTNSIIRRGTDPQLLPEIFHDNLADARQSLDALAATGAELLLPGHGSPWRGPINEAVRLAKG